MRRVRDILRPGGAFVSIEEWPIRVTNGASASQFERQIMENIRPIELAVLYHELEEYGFKLVRFVESEIIPGGMVKINPLHPDMVDEVTYTHQRFHSMFVAVFVKS
jgi:hypothetical protein